MSAFVLLVLHSALALEVELVATGDFLPTDAAPSADGSVVWFLTDDESGSALYRVEADGTVVRRAGFEHAMGLAQSADDRTVWVGDARGVWAVPAAGGPVRPVAGGLGYEVHQLDVAGRLVFAATAPDGSEGVFALSPREGRVRRLAGGFEAPPTGAFVLAPGDLVVALEDGSLYRQTGGERMLLASGVQMGLPTGMALGPDGSTLMVSSLSEAGTSQVLLVDVDVGVVGTFEEVIGANVGSGGLHQASGAAVWAWAGITSGGSGAVYRIHD